MRDLLLRLLKLADRPDVPPGSSESVSMFRASPRYFWYSILGWAAGQTGALFGILIPLGGVDHLTRRAFNFRVSGFAVPDIIADAEFQLATLGVDWTFRIGTLIRWVGIFAILVFVLQLVISFLLLRLAWEMRWYIVTDTAIRIREGLMRTREQTLTIAKIQNLKTHQGPLQRLFRIADLEVRTAGGGGGSSSDSDKDGKSSARVGRFRGLEDVEALRDRLRALQARHKHSGVDDTGRRPARKGAVAVGGRLTSVAGRMLEEASAIRRVLESSGDAG